MADHLQASACRYIRSRCPRTLCICHDRKRKHEAMQQHTASAPTSDPTSAKATGGGSTSGKQAAALGLGTPPDACGLWGVIGCARLAAVDKTLAARARALAHAMAAVSAARLAASVAADVRWTQAALTALKQVHETQCGIVIGRRVIPVCTAAGADCGSRALQLYVFCTDVVKADRYLHMLVRRQSSGWRLPASEAWLKLHAGLASARTAQDWRRNDPSLDGMCATMAD